MKQHLSIPIIAGLLFGVFGALAAASTKLVITNFAREAGVSDWIFIAVPALFAMMFAVIVYQGAEKRVQKLGHSLSRGLLVAILTWVAFSALATWAWCLPEHYGQCYSQALMVSGVLGGGQMLLAALVAAAITGYTIIGQHSRIWKATD